MEQNIESSQRYLQYLLEIFSNRFSRFSNSSKKVYIPGSIIYKKFDNHNQGYWACGKILHAILIHYDKIFADQVYTYLENKRLKDNELMIEKLSRVVPDDDYSQWSLFISKEYKDSIVIFTTSYSRNKQHKPKNIIYNINNLANGWTLKKRIHPRIINEIRCIKYIDKSRYKYVVDRELYDCNPNYFDFKLRSIAAEERKLLNWRPDIKTK